MVKTSRDWSEKLSFALWTYHTFIGATPFSLVYGMEAILPFEMKVSSLTVELEHQITKTDWLQIRYD